MVMLGYQEAGALQPLPLLETLFRDQTALDRQLLKAIGVLIVLKANDLVLGKTPQLHYVAAPRHA